MLAIATRPKCQKVCKTIARIGQLHAQPGGPNKRGRKSLR